MKFTKLQLEQIFTDVNENTRTSGVTLQGAGICCGASTLYGISVGRYASNMNKPYNIRECIVDILLTIVSASPPTRFDKDGKLLFYPNKSVYFLLDRRTESRGRKAINTNTTKFYKTLAKYIKDEGLGEFLYASKATPNPVHGGLLGGSGIRGAVWQVDLDGFRRWYKRTIPANIARQKSERIRAARRTAPRW